MAEIDYSKVKDDLIVGYVGNYLSKQKLNAKSIGKCQKSSSDQQLINSLHSLKNVIDRYIDPILMDEALAAIDLEKIYSGVDKREAKTDGTTDSNLGYDDYLVKELLHYFKSDFFTWINKPKCPLCQVEDNVQSIGAERFSGIHNPDDILIVEKYKCNTCSSYVDFPRINNPVSLLKTRSGRCGEWVNCFLLILLALLNDVNRIRYVWNLEDHVWVEYYSTKMSRWIHLDPCEAAFDEPLLYCENWGKQMSWVIGFNQKYIIDLSKKYISPTKQKSLKNYNLSTIERSIDSMNCQKIADFNQKFDYEKYLEIYYQYLLPRNQELDNLKQGPHQKQKPKPDSKKGRQTGSIEWTTSRGEAGN